MLIDLLLLIHNVKRILKGLTYLEADLPKTGYRQNGMIDLRRLPQIVFRPLMRHRADGMASQLLHATAGDTTFTPPTLEVDSALNGRVKLETILHEALHLAAPFLQEETVLKIARYQAMIVWHLQYRDPDNQE